MYLLGLQLLLPSGLGSVLAGASGLAAGLAYRLNLLGLKRFRVGAVGAVGGWVDPPRARTVTRALGWLGATNSWGSSGTEWATPCIGCRGETDV